MAAVRPKKQKLLASPGRLSSRSAESTPLVILQRHDDTARLDAVLSARREESRLRELSRSKAAQIAASHRRTRARVKVYRALVEEVENLRFREPPGRRAASSACSRTPSATTPDVFEAEVMCAVNPKFVESAREFGSSQSANSSMSGRRRLQSAQKFAKPLSYRSTSTGASFAPELKEEAEEEEEEEEKGVKEARQKKEEEEEEEDDLTEVTLELLPDTQRTEASDLLPSVPHLLLTPGRGSHQPSASSPRSCKLGGCGAVRSARGLDLYFYPKLLLTSQALPEAAGERRTLDCRRFFAEQERESARRTRQQRHAERRASRLKSAAERRRQQQEEAEEERRRAQEAEEEERPQLAESRGPLAAAPQRSFAAARAALRDWSLAAGVQVPALCPCAEDVFDCEPEQCAQNCPFFRDPDGFLRALRSLLPLEDKN